jgi:hypothetical protein
MTKINSHHTRRATRPAAVFTCLLLATAFSIASTSAANAAGDPDTPQGYAVRLPVTIQADAALQRLVLPAQVLVALQSGGMNDLRIFNGAGQPVPMALSNPMSTQIDRARIPLQALPIFGSGDPGNQGQGQLSLRIEERQGRRVVQVDSNGQKLPQSQRQIIGALFDTRAIIDPVVGATLDVKLPDAQPVTFTIEASRDLRNWEPLAETVLYRQDSSANRLGVEDIALPARDIAKSYLRVTWRDAADNPVPAVKVQGVTLTTGHGVVNAARVTATVDKPVLADAHTVRFALPFATPVAAIRIQPAGTNVLVPVRVLTRGSREEPWTVLADGVVYNMSTAGKPQNSGAIELQGASSREMKIEADQKTAGFATSPKISVAFEPVQIIFLANGAGPYTLAAGRPNVASPYLPLASLIPAYRAGREAALPKASVELAGVPAAVIGGGSDGDGIPVRSIVLWAVLLLGAALLGLMAWRLMKQNTRGGDGV